MEEANTTAPAAGASRWGVKEIVTVVLFSVLNIVVMLMASSLALFNDDVAMLVTGGLGCLIGGPIFVFMTRRVDRFGTTAIFSAIVALVFCTIANMLYMVPLYLAVGLAIDLAFLRRPEHRAKPGRIVAGWTAFSGFYVLSSIFPIIFNLDEYVAQMMSGPRQVTEQYIQTYLHYYTDPAWVAGIVVFSMVLGFLGAKLGARLARKHFEKAGVL